MILAGAIVGSGELIATPKVGAEAGFWLLWLIILGCTLKVFVQIEFGRHTITWGQTALAALDRLPGPRWKVNWLLWYWFAVVLLIVSQNGGIVGGVGQALAMAMPVTAAGEEYNEVQDDLVRARVASAEARREGVPLVIMAGIEATERRLEERARDLANPRDTLVWATVIAVLTSVIMGFGHYKFIEVASTLMVGAFTVVTFVALYMLQATPWAISAENVAQGLQFRLPPAGTAGAGLSTALAAFGMIGLAAGEIIMYPYWCLDKGYAAHTGPRTEAPDWAARARAWMRVLQLDVWLSMFVYTFSTVAFYLLGAAILGRTGLSPEGEGMIRTLAQMYIPVFGDWSEGLFLFGAVTVLYSTYFVFAAGFSRIMTDALILLQILEDTPRTRGRWQRILSVSLPLLALLLYITIGQPVDMILWSGLGQATVLPMLGAAALYFRYYRLDTRLRPPVISDILLWLSFAGLLIIGIWSVYSNLIATP
jgi:hypothetical protein